MLWIKFFPSGKNSVRNLQYGLRIRLVRGMYCRLSHDVVTLGCRSRRFDCLLLVFFRRYTRLIARNHLYHKDRL